MLHTPIILIIGIFIGWNLPQPPWAWDLQARVASPAKALRDKNRRRR
jgi:hypothetical protein